MYVLCHAYAIIVVNQLSFKECSSSGYGGGLYVYSVSSKFNITGFCLFQNCESQIGGGCFLVFLSYEASFITNDLVLFDNCTSENGGGIYSKFYSLGTMLSNNYSFNDCAALSGGGIFLEIDSGTFKIDGTTFNSCICAQPGNGGGIALIHKPSSIISITNSSFISCKTISNSLDQRYGWGGAIFIQTSIIAENLIESNFLLRDLVFTGCSTVNSIGNNIHIQSANTYATGEAIKNINLLTVKDLLNPPNIISDLYTSSSYAYDYMGINQSIETDNPGTTDLDLHNPLFEQLFTSNVPNPSYIDSIYGKNIKFCGGIQTIGGQATISNSTFDQCEDLIGGGIYTFLESGGKLTIDGQCNITQCKTSSAGGGIYAYIAEMNSLLTLEDGLKFERCNSDWSSGGGAYIYIQDHGT
ncbi:MAG: hypothetical protein EZS28_038750, partial [Streblomastix strix]